MRHSSWIHLLVLQSQFLVSHAFTQQPLVGKCSTSFVGPLGASNKAVSSELSEKQLDFTLGYLNKHHSDFLIETAKAFSELGVEQVAANTFSGGSYIISEAEITSIDTKSLDLKVTIQRRTTTKIETVSVELGTYVGVLKVDGLRYRKKKTLTFLPQTRTPSLRESECM